MDGRLIRPGRSEAEAGEKEAFYLGAVPHTPPSGKDQQTAPERKMCQVLHFYCTSETFDHFCFPSGSKNNYFSQSGCIHMLRVSSLFFISEQHCLVFCSVLSGSLLNF